MTLDYVYVTDIKFSTCFTLIVHFVHIWSKCPGQDVQQTQPIQIMNINLGSSRPIFVGMNEV